jgi:hypothetical protein
MWVLYKINSMTFCVYIIKYIDKYYKFNWNGKRKAKLNLKSLIK